MNISMVIVNLADVGGVSMQLIWSLSILRSGLPRSSTFKEKDDGAKYQAHSSDGINCSSRNQILYKFPDSATDIEIEAEAEVEARVDAGDGDELREPPVRTKFAELEAFPTTITVAVAVVGTALVLATVARLFVEPKFVIEIVLAEKVNGFDTLPRAARIV